MTTIISWLYNDTVLGTLIFVSHMLLYVGLGILGVRSANARRVAKGLPPLLKGAFFN